MKNKRLWVSILAGFMAFMMLFGLIASIIPTAANAASSSEIQSQIDELEEEESKIQDQIAELAEKQKDNLSDIEDILEQKNYIDQQIALLHAEIANINEQISAYSLLIADKQDELDEAERHLAELSEKNKERIRAMEEDGVLSYWSVLFQANSFSDLLDRLNMVEEIAASDQRRLSEMREAAQIVSAAREELETEKAALELTKESLHASEAELAVKRGEADELITSLLAKGEELDLLMHDFEDQEQALLVQIAEKEAELNEAKEREYQQWLSTSRPSNSGGNGGNGGGDGGGSDVFVGGDWIVPCSYVYVSSPYGYREHPVYGGTRFHHGIDLAAYQGTPIYASRGGTVTSATYDNASGYYVTVNHGDGFSSSYLHMTHYVVSSGDYVDQGDLLGYVGSTGASTGPHLHFSIYYNGSSVNPANYIAF